MCAEKSEKETNKEQVVRVSDGIHALRIPFTIPLGPGKVLERFVYVYFIYGDTVTMVDAGVSSSTPAIFDYLVSTGRKSADITRIVLTHAHPDHIGGAAAIAKETGCTFAAHRDSVGWVEDTNRQFAERPVPGFQTLVGGPVHVDRILDEGDVIELPGNGSLSVIATPGHAAGQIALLHDSTGALFTGDAVPVPGEIPIYDDAHTLVQSLEKLRTYDTVSVLLSSWDEPRYGNDIRRVIDDGIAWMHRIHDTVMQCNASSDMDDAASIARQVLESLGLPGALVNPLIVKSVVSHLNCGATLV